MKTQTRKAVSPIIATLLLIAITVAAGVVVYVFVGGLSANLSKSGGNQVTEQLSMDAYISTKAGTNITNGITLALRNTGSAAVTISSVYLDGSAVALKSGNTAPTSIAPGNKIVVAIAGSFTTNSATYLQYTTAATLSSGTSYQVKVVTLDGAIFTFNVIAGSSG